MRSVAEEDKVERVALSQHEISLPSAPQAYHASEMHASQHDVHALRTQTLHYTPAPADSHSLTLYHMDADFCHRYTRGLTLLSPTWRSSNFSNVSSRLTRTVPIPRPLLFSSRIHPVVVTSAIVRVCRHGTVIGCRLRWRADCRFQSHLLPHRGGADCCALLTLGAASWC